LELLHTLASSSSLALESSVAELETKAGFMRISQPAVTLSLPHRNELTGSKKQLFSDTLSPQIGVAEAEVLCIMGYWLVEKGSEGLKR